jgi:DNA-binding MarR family transcriptional regulator
MSDPLPPALPELELDPQLAEKLRTLDALLWRVNLIHMRGAAIAQLLHGEGEFSGGRRSLLRNLVQDGPATVPQLARVRAVSRQFIQRLINELLAEGLVELVPNPQHRRSKLVRATAQGYQRYLELSRREAQFGAHIAADLDHTELASTLQTLDQLWKELVRGHERLEDAMGER